MNGVYPGKENTMNTEAALTLLRVFVLCLFTVLPLVLIWEEEEPKSVKERMKDLKEVIKMQ